MTVTNTNPALCHVKPKVCGDFTGVEACECEAKTSNLLCSWDASFADYKGRCLRTAKPWPPTSWNGKYF